MSVFDPLARWIGDSGCQVVGGIGAGVEEMTTFGELKRVNFETKSSVLLPQNKCQEQCDNAKTLVMSSWGSSVNVVPLKISKPV